MSADGWTKKGPGHNHALQGENTRVIEERRKAEAEREELRAELERARQHNHALQTENTRVIEERRKVEAERAELRAELKATQEALGTLTDLRRQCEVLAIERDALRAQVGRLLAAIDRADEQQNTG